MLKSLMDTYSNEEFTEIVLSSNSYKECLLKLGYASNSGDATKNLKAKIEKMNIDTSHFSIDASNKIDRSRENVFVENSTCAQKTLRRFYKKETEDNYVCSICGLEPIWNNKPLTLILDHIDGKNHNNVLSNLRWVCPNCNMQLDTTNGKNKIRNEYQNKCIDCGKIISRDAIRCIDCQRKHRIYEYSPPINREDLKKKIRNETFKEIGREFNVTDNAVRKWCDYFNLPRRQGDIDNYNDSEWENI